MTNKYDELLNHLYNLDDESPELILQVNISDTSLRRALKSRLADLNAGRDLMEEEIKFTHLTVSRPFLRDGSNHVKVNLYKSVPKKSGFEFTIVEIPDAN